MKSESGRTYTVQASPDHMAWDLIPRGGGKIAGRVWKHNKGFAAQLDDFRDSEPRWFNRRSDAVDWVTSRFEYWEASR